MRPLDGEFNRGGSFSARATPRARSAGLTLHPCHHELSGHWGDGDEPQEAGKRTCHSCGLYERLQRLSTAGLEPSHAAPHTHGRKAGLPDEKGSASPARTLRLGYLARLAASLAAQLHHSSGQQLSVDLTTCDRCCMCGCTPVGRVMRACARVDYLYVDATTWWSCRVHSLLSLYM